MTTKHQGDVIDGDVHTNNDTLGLFNNGRLDYRKVAELAKLSKDDLSKMAKVAKSSVRFDDAIPSVLAARLHEVAMIANLVAQYFAGEVYKVELWFELANPQMGGVSPTTLIRGHRTRWLLNFVVDAHNAERSAI